MYRFPEFLWSTSSSEWGWVMLPYVPHRGNSEQQRLYTIITGPDCSRTREKDRLHLYHYQRALRAIPTAEFWARNNGNNAMQKELTGARQKAVVFCFLLLCLQMLHVRATLSAAVQLKQTDNFLPSMQTT